MKGSLGMNVKEYGAETYCLNARGMKCLSVCGVKFTGRIRNNVIRVEGGDLEGSVQC